MEIEIDFKKMKDIEIEIDLDSKKEIDKFKIDLCKLKLITLSCVPSSQSGETWCIRSAGASFIPHLSSNSHQPSLSGSKTTLITSLTAQRHY